MSGSSPPQLGALLRTYRVRAGLSQEALATASGVSVRAISDLERGARTSPHLETVRLLGTALDLSPAALQELLAAARPVDGNPGSGSVEPPGTGPVRWSAPLPRPGATLYGREAELALLAERIRPSSGQILTLTGPGGVGKTGLALAAARRAAPTFADGAVFVDLAAIAHADQVPNAIAQALGIPISGGSAAERVLAVLASRELLLVLDNAEHLIDIAPYLATLAAAAPRVQVVVTSRVRLRVSTERELPVPPLAVAEPGAPLEELRASGAIQLFIERARAADRDFALTEGNASQVAELCRRLDGLPLAIELAASRLRMLSVGVLLDRHPQLPLLTGGYRDLPQRQQSMRDTIAWSYDLLQPTEQQVFRWLAVFVGGCSLRSAEALGGELGLTDPETLDVFAALSENALVQRVPVSDGEPRLYLFETMREFALEQLEQRQELDDARRFHARHFLAFAEQGSTRPEEPVDGNWLAAAFVERHNLLAAFDALCQPETAELGLMFAAAMGPYWWSVGPHAEGSQRLLRAIALASAEPTVAEIHARFWACFMLADALDLSTALEVAHAGRARADEIGSPTEQAIALHALAWVEEHCEHWDVVRTLLDDALQRWTALDKVFMQAMSLMLLGGVDYADGNLALAEARVQRAGELFIDIGEPSWAGGTYWYQGRIAASAGQLAAAVKHYQHCLRTWFRDPYSLRWFKPLVGLADVAVSLGEPERAARLIGASDELRRTLGMELMLSDAPSYEHATAAARAALGPDRFRTLVEQGAHLTPDGWLAEASALLDADRIHQHR